MAKYRGQDNVVGTATRYGLEGPVFELLWEQNFLLSILFQTGPVVQSTSSTKGTGVLS
jgi:hypothetical protein